MSPDELEARLDQLYSSAHSASSEGLRDEALRRCEEALALLEDYGEETERHSYADFVMLMGDCYWGAGEYEDAYRSYNRVVVNEPDRLDARVATGVALYHLCRFTAAKAVLEMCSLDIADDGETWYYLGLIALREERHELAMHFFETAAELEEQRFHIPSEVPEHELREMLTRLMEEIPEPFRNLLRQLPIEIRDQPPEELLFSCDPPMDPSLLGIFEGTAPGDPGATPGVVSIERIVLFRGNISLLAHEPQKLEEELWNTLRGEIGHFLGMSDEELAERGMD